MASIVRCPRSYQRLILRCVLAAALVIAILCFGSAWPPAVNADGSPSKQLSERDALQPQEILATDEPTKQPADAHSPVAPQVQHEYPSPSREEAKAHTVTASDKQISQAIHQIEGFLDDEYRLKALLSPITETGEPLLRDLTHRVRAFRKVFQTWEDLHLFQDGGKSKIFSSRS